MRTRRQIIPLFTLLLAVVGVVVWRMAPLGEGEPVYRGRPLRAWVEQYRRSLADRSVADKYSREEAETAIRAMGTKTVPGLLRMVRARDTRLKLKLMSLLDRWTKERLSLRSARFDHLNAQYGFQLLGPAAKPAVPALTRLLADADPDVRACAARSLAGIGREAGAAVPALLRLLEDRNHPLVMEEAIFALGNIHQQRDAVVPALREFVDGGRRDWNCSVAAIGALMKYGEVSDNYVSALHDLLWNRDAGIRAAAFEALIRVPPATNTTNEARLRG